MPVKWQVSVNCTLRVVNFTIMQATVRLHNPSSGNFIGEVFYAKYIDSTTMAFELTNKPGHRLRIAENGRVGNLLMKFHHII